MKRMPIFTSLLIYLLFVASACTRMKEPEFREIENFRIEKPGIESSDVVIDVRLYNPNNFGVKLKETSTDFYVDSIFIGNLAQDSMIAVAANSSFIIPLKGKVQLKKLLKNGLSLIFNNEVLIRADGNTKVGKAGVYIKYPFHYEGRQSLNFFR